MEYFGGGVGELRIFLEHKVMACLRVDDLVVAFVFACADVGTSLCPLYDVNLDDVLAEMSCVSDDAEATDDEPHGDSCSKDTGDDTDAVDLLSRHSI